MWVSTIFKYYFDTNLLLSSISNLLIKTDTIKTFLKSLSLKHFLDNFNILLLSSFPKAKNSKQRSLKLSVLQLFGKLMPFYQMLMGSRQSHYTQKMGPWTQLTLSLFNVLSAMLKTEESGGWLIAVAYWHMLFLTRQINQHAMQHNQVTCHAHIIITHIKLSCTCNLNNIFHPILTMLTFLNLIYTYMCPIIVEIEMHILQQVISQAVRCVASPCPLHSISLHFIMQPQDADTSLIKHLRPYWTLISYVQNIQL